MYPSKLFHLIKTFHTNPVKPNLLRPSLAIHFRPQQNYSTKTCWKCGIIQQNVQNLFCPSCKTIQNPTKESDKNYFNLFNLNFTYNIDQKYLTQHYRKMQSLLHPDKFTNSTDEEKKISEEYSSLINKGYNTLQGPLSRALHMLRLNNEVIEEGNKSDDPEFLMEVMELNEELEEADGEEKLRKIELKNKKMLVDISTVISGCFERDDVKGAKKAIIKMKYYDSLSKRIHDLLREKGIVD